MADPLGIAAQLLSPAFAKVAGAPATDPVVRASDHADAQANGALDVARRLGRNPRQVAGEILAATGANPVASLDVAGPGFINVTFRGPFLDERSQLFGRRLHEFVQKRLAHDAGRGLIARHRQRQVVLFQQPRDEFATLDGRLFRVQLVELAA